MKCVPLLLLCLASLSGCQSDSGHVERDITYYHELELDLYLPESDRSNAVVLIRGGWWQRGDKEGMASLARALAADGIAVASIEFPTSYPESVEAAKAAIDWMEQNADDYGFLPGVGAIGCSSGGQVALMLSAEYGIGPIAVLAPVSSFESADDQVLARYLGKTPTAEASPIQHAHELVAPILIIHSRTDETIPFWESKALAELLSNAQLDPLENAPHAFWNIDTWRDQVVPVIADFIDQH